MISPVRFSTVQLGGKLANNAEIDAANGRVGPTRVGRDHGIEAASREQAAGIEQINRAMAQMDQLTQRDALMAQELISTAEALQSQSDQMLAAISAFSRQSVGARTISSAEHRSGQSIEKSALHAARAA